MCKKTEKLLTYIDQANMADLEIGARRLEKAYLAALRKLLQSGISPPRWFFGPPLRISNIRFAFLNARMAREARLEGFIDVALDHESLTEHYAAQAFGCQ